MLRNIVAGHSHTEDKRLVRQALFNSTKTLVLYAVGLHMLALSTVAGTRHVYYMWRGCQRRGSPGDRCVSEVHYEDCRRTCSADLCNGDDMSVSSTSTSQRQSAAARGSYTAGSPAPNFRRLFVLFDRIASLCALVLDLRVHGCYYDNSGASAYVLSCSRPKRYNRPMHRIGIIWTFF